MNVNLIDGKKVSKELQIKLKKRVSSLRQKGIVPKLAVILVGNNAASKVYVRNKQITAEKLGIETLNINFDKNISESELIKKIDELNNDATVDGILVQLPLPKQIDESKVTQRILPNKDVDGFHPVNMGKLFTNEIGPQPCTPRGIMELLKYYNLEISGKNVVIIGRSNIVGRPMAAFMLNEDATVTITHSKTKNLKKITRQADIVIVAIGKAEFIDATYLKDDAIVIDVGMNRNKAGKLVGDVNQTSVSKKVKYLTPVPGGVGPMTITMLMQQTIELAEKRINNE